jgi:phenylacetate-CoA ligase
MHLCAENAYVEFLSPSGQPARDGEIGELIVTGLNNFSMPLIRYSIGDVGVAGGAAACPCGRGLPLLASVEGRTSDIIVLPNGKLVHGEYFTHLFYGRNGLRQFQVLQTSPGVLKVSLVVDDTFDRGLPERIAQEIVSYFGVKLDIAFEYTNDIPPTTTGKRRFTVSTVSFGDSMKA